MISGGQASYGPALERALVFGVTTELDMFADPTVARALRQLKSARVAILAGSDAPNPGTANGVSIHREMELLVAAGLSPVEVLAAATSAPARASGLADRGRIARGLRADLVLVRGNPDQDITATRDILHVWKGGHPVGRPES